MNYPTLRIVSTFIKLFAVIGLIGVVVIFVMLLMQVNWQLAVLDQTYSAAREALGLMQYANSLLGVQVKDLPDLRTAFQWQIYTTIAEPFLFLFGGIVACFLVYGFGGLIAVVVDMASLQFPVSFEQISPADRDPLIPRPLADFPQSRFSNRPARSPSSPDERYEARRGGKWDVGR